MALLSSEDEQVKTSFEIKLLIDNLTDKKDISWIPYTLNLISANKELLYKKEDGGTGDYVFALTPVNEIERLIEGARYFLNNESSKGYSFEPLEPSFELIVERSHKGYSINVWVDAGNVISDHYTWDGFGLRFFTTKEKIDNFLLDLEKEIKELPVRK